MRFENQSLYNEKLILEIAGQRAGSLQAAGRGAYQRGRHSVIFQKDGDFIAERLEITPWESGPPNSLL